MIDLFYVVSLLIQLLYLPLGLAAQGSTPGTALVAGQIRFGGRPLPGVKLVLRPERMTARDDLSETQSDEHGNFRITGLRAGTYIISLRDDEFIMTGAVFNVAGARGMRLNLAEGEHLENLDLELIRGSVISGRITDANGRPVVRERIELTRLKEDGKPQDTPFNQPGLSLTDEQGIYHLRGLPAGRYLLSVGTASEAGPGRQPANSSAYAKTFYPGVTDPAQAKAVEIITGAEVTGIEMLKVAAKRTYVIRGRVVSAETGEPVAGAEIRYGTLIAGMPRVSGWRPSRERSNEVGEFQIPGLVTGKYAIYASALPERELFSDAVVLEIVDGTIEGVELKIGRGVALSGVVVIEGTEDPDVLAKLSQIQLIGMSIPEQPRITPLAPAIVNRDGSFHLKGLQSGKVKLGLVVPVSGGWFRIKRVEREGIIQPEGIELRQDEHLDNVRVVVSQANLTLRGEVRVIGGTLPAYLGLSVNANRLHEDIPSGNTAFVDARGQFVIEQLMPGEYEVRVISLILQPGEPHDPQLLKLIAGARQKITIGGGSSPKLTFVIDLTQKGSQ